ncbi:glycosyltransferase family 4 protein [Thermotoga caldifontis]|uniref:glycosyltransferase family 4 protein n=1 Tax=Thermotoga caldifontis TaxID=1508419 RepID=UPI000597936E|nr:glycosyltransferase family 1 protein [Thermotoga caldifontis]
MRVGINLLWLKPKAIGGVEVFVKNLLRGIDELSPDMEFVVFVNRTALDYVKSWRISDRYRLVVKDVDPFNVFRTLIYQRLHMKKLCEEYRIDLLYHPTPIYPIGKIRKAKQMVTIHDLQFLHYPQYATKLQRLKYLYSWKKCLQHADKVIAISNFTKQDILNNFHVKEDKITVIHNPVVLPETPADFSEISKRLGVGKKEYFYTISSLLPHKNTEVLIRLMKLIEQEKPLALPKKLIISGIGKMRGTRLERMINEFGLSDRIIFTGFVSDEEKRALLENCYCFLFPSLFEGFGMPPVEALMLNVPVVTTKAGAIEETTMGLAIYVDNPTDEREWLEKIVHQVPKFSVVDADRLKDEYDFRNICQRYINVFYELGG